MKVYVIFGTLKGLTSVPYCCDSIWSTKEAANVRLKNLQASGTVGFYMEEHILDSVPS